MSPSLLVWYQRLLLCNQLNPIVDGVGPRFPDLQTNDPWPRHVRCAVDTYSIKADTLREVIEVKNGLNMFGSHRPLSPIRLGTEKKVVFVFVFFFQNQSHF